MAELLGNERRTHYCGDLRESDIGKTVCVMGWVQKQRDLGSLIFVDLRDRTGIVQLAFDEGSDRSVFDKAFTVRSEYVLSVTGVARERSSKNPNLPTGNIEIFVESLKILAVSETPPFDIIENSKANEELRLKHRYLDLRRPDLQKKLLFRHKVAKVTRDYFDEQGFIEIETPILIKSTPEGARDYLVPSRVHKGSFYALPQSPQLYKQLSMVAGFDRYMQIARCFRDEDLRADRQPEFTQIDLEMSFVDMDDVLVMVEGFVKRLFTETLNVDVPLPLPRYTYREVMDRFGSDKPDMRFGMEINDFSKIVENCGFSVFTDAIKNGGSVRGITIKCKAEILTRKEIDKLTEYVKGCGAKGLAWVRRAAGQVTSSFVKFMSEEEMALLLEAADCDEGDVLLIIADGNTSNALTQLGQLRIETANRLNIERSGYSFLWVIEMPFFELDKETGEWAAMHHPFTAPLDECIKCLDTDKGNVRAKAYDLVLNGIELSSGSIRITNPELQSKIFTLLGLSDEEAKTKFGYLLDAFRFGPPPHGGMGIGLDRLVMQMLGAESLRDVVAYPKVQNASELMTSCPAIVPEKALKELGISLNNE
ncbi:MAG: aspartate--tRNA ligase [Clostridiales bacterium GWF2_36_10]|nr:MAG: aspartate--tRNA ligase [Clostridiales bacterium GWF2_36_10]HAN20565.1 aspartate--tRNA ligase [Clostridiales bacterium]